MSDRIFTLLFISFLLLLVDWYIYKAVRSVKPKWLSEYRKAFPYVWWGYSILLIIGVFISIFFNIRLTLRSKLGSVIE